MIFIYHFRVQKAQGLQLATVRVINYQTVPFSFALHSSLFVTSYTPFVRGEGLNSFGFEPGALAGIQEVPGLTKI